MVITETAKNGTGRRGEPGARPERIRRAQARVAAAVEAGYLAQLGRELRLTTARTPRVGDTCPGA